MTPAQVDKIVNATVAGWEVVAVMVPTRAVRIIRDDLAIAFRVEQLDAAANYTWRPVSTHLGDIAWESFEPAVKDAMAKQARLKEKIKLAQHEARMATIRAQEATQ